MSTSARKERFLARRQKENFKTLEWEARNYYNTKKELEFMRQEIIEGSKARETPSEKHRISDPTAIKAMRLTTSAALRETERRVAAVEYAIGVFETSGEPARMKVIEMSYLDDKERFAWHEIAARNCIAQGTLYKWRREFIYLIADRLGWDVGQKTS